MKAYEVITEKILQKLKEGVAPWSKPWKGGGSDYAPRNYVSKKLYRGINVIMLMMSGYASPYWLTFKQAKERGGSVLLGEKGTPVVYWNWIEKKKNDNDGNENEEDTKRKVPFMKYYTVFNIEQTTLEVPKEKVEEPKTENEKIEACENVVANMPKKPNTVHKEQRAYYSPSQDYINMPKFETFTGSEEYYSVLFHEMTHSTGHESRLDRKKEYEGHTFGFFGSKEYSKEELVAEMGAAFLCGFTGIDNKTIDNSAAYIDNWLKVLESDKKMVILAAAKAQKAVDFILDKKPENENGETA